MSILVIEEVDCKSRSIDHIPPVKRTSIHTYPEIPGLTLSLVVNLYRREMVSVTGFCLIIKVVSF